MARRSRCRSWILSGSGPGRTNAQSWLIIGSLLDGRRVSDTMQDHFLQRQNETPSPLRQQKIPESRTCSNELVHRETQANVPTRAVLGIRFSAIFRVPSNYQRCFVWGIENRDHYVRDVTLGEDASRIRHKPGGMARIRSAALN